MMHIPDYMDMRMDYNGVITLTNIFSRVFGTGTTIEDAMHDYQRNASNYVERMLEQSLIAHADIWQELAKH